MSTPQPATTDSNSGALPELPFEDRAFDLTLTGNFLLVYAPLADGGMHDGAECGLGFAVGLVASDYDDGCQAGDRDSEQVHGVLVARRR